VRWLSGVRPGFSSTTTIIGIRIRMSALTYAKKYKLSQALPLGKKSRIKSKALVSSRRRRLMKSKAMKRIGNIYDKITSLKNLQDADIKSSEGKANQYGVTLHNQNKEGNLLVLARSAVSKTYRTSDLRHFQYLRTEGTHRISFTLFSRSHYTSRHHECAGANIRKLIHS
jgi:hypothetical protein